MKKNYQLFILLIITVIMLEISFVGCGGGGGGGSSSSDSTSNGQKLTYIEGNVLQDGSFFLTSNSESSNLNIKAERNTISKDSKITLIERKPTSNESGLFKNLSTNVYKLVAVTNGKSSLLSSKTNIERAKKPFRLEISQVFPNNITSFYLGRRASSDADWQYSKLYQNGKNTYSNSNNDSSLTGSFRAVSVATVSYTFTIDTTTFGDEFAVFGETPASSTLEGINRVKEMNFTTSLPYLDLKYNSNGEMVYNTDLVINTAVEAEKAGSIFSGAKVQTILSFLSNNSDIIENLRVVGKTTSLATQKVSEEGSGGGNQYTHTIYFDDYISEIRNGNISTYTFTLKIRDLLLTEFPAIFNIKTIFIDNSIPIAYATDADIEREMLLSYLEPISPVLDDGRVEINSNLVMKYIAHNIASAKVKYICAGQESTKEMPGSFSVDEENHLVTFTPDEPWPPFQTITASATLFCCNEHKTTSLRTAKFSFKTEAVSSDAIDIGSNTYIPVMISMIEPNPPTEVPTNSQITLQFSDDIAWQNSYRSLISLSSGTVSTAITKPTYDSTEKTLTFKAENGLKYNAIYTLKFDLLIDNTNHKLISPATFTFTTENGIHAQASIAPTASSIVNDRFISKPAFIVDFGKPIVKNTLINENRVAQAVNSIRIYKGNTLLAEKNFSRNWTTPYQKLKITFDEPLEASSTYKITMGNGVLDYENLPIDPFEPYVFSTMPNLKTKLLAPSTPVDVPIDTEIKIKFSDQLNWKSSYSSYFYILKGNDKIPIASYVYDSDNYILTITPKNLLNYNSSYTVAIVQPIQNDPSIQYIERNYYRFETCDGEHYKATACIATDSFYNLKTKTQTTIEVKFGDSVENANIAKAAIKLKRNGTEVQPLTPVTWADTNSKLTLTYSLKPETTYTVSMATGVKTINGNYIDPFDEISFDTVDNITATVTVPVNEENVATNSKIVFAFSDDINWDNTVKSKEFFNLYFGITNVTSTIKSFDYSKAAKTLTITPNYLFYNGSYTISLIEGLTNKETGQKIKPALFSFKTEEGDQACATASISLASLKGNKTILTPTINVDFTRPVSNTTSLNIGLYNGPILLKNFTKKWSSDKSKVDLVFNSLLSPNTEYTLKMIDFVLDNQGIPIAPFDDLSFTTLGTITATLASPSPTTDVASSSSIVIKFSDEITWNSNKDAETVPLRQNGKDVEIKSYYYSNADNTLTLVPKSPLIYNTTFSLRINQWLQNDYTGQKVATATFEFSTSDGDHDKANVMIDPASIVDSRVILRPTIIVDYKNDLLSTDRQKGLEAVKVYKGNTEVTDLFKNWIKEYSKFKITFSSKLEHSQTYTVAINENLKNITGNIIEPFDDLNFTTLDAIDIQLTSPSKTTNVSTTTPIILTFSSPIEWLNSYSNKISFKIGNTVLKLAKCEYNSNNRTVTLTPSDPLLYNTTYTISVKEGFINNDTQQTTKNETFNFTTIDSTHSIATLIVSENDKIDDKLCVTPTFVVNFGKNVLNATNAANAIQISKGDQVFTKVTKTWIASNRQLEITCDSMLDSDTQYKVSMNTGVKDCDGTDIDPFEDYFFTTTSNGKGSERSPYLIYTASQLDYIRKDLNACYKLMKDINIATSSYLSSTNTNDKGWEPIGDNNNKFTGILDGDEHTISGLSINRPNAASVGLFGQTASATLKNIYLSSGSVKGENVCGSLVGYAYNSKITKCKNINVEVKGVSRIGGICGELYSSYGTNLKNSGRVSSTDNIAGGIVGWNNIYSTLNSCYNNGNISSLKDKVGGIAGENNATILNCCNEGSINGFEYIGSIVGSNHTTRGCISYCIAAGNISCQNTNKTNIGAIAGYTEKYTQIFNCSLTNETIINSTACQDNSNLAFNFSDSTNEYCNHFFNNMTTMNNAIYDASYWVDGQAWDSSIWQKNRTVIPSLINLP